MNRISRRTVAQGAAGIGAGALAAGHIARVAAQEATPAAEVASPVVDSQALGYASLRVRQLAEAGFRAEVNTNVIENFVQVVQLVDGYAGYLLGDVIEDETQSLAIVMLDEMSQVDRFNSAAGSFVGRLDPKYAVETPTTAEGDILVVGAPVGGEASPVVATPVTGGGSAGYVAARIYESLPGTDPREFAPQVQSGFLPIVQGLPGFQGYFFFPSEGGFTSVSLFDSEAAAQESTEAGTAWAAENLSAYTSGDPQVINAAVVFSDLPILLARV
jgi:hypothetical protein